MLGAGIIGLFLLGILVTRIRSGASIAVLLAAMLLIAWMTISKTDYWPTSLAAFASPFHPLLVIVIGPTLMVLLGYLTSMGSPHASDQT